MKYTIEPVVDSGVPLGGLGTGTIELRADGQFHNWQIFNNPPWTSEIAGNTQQDNTRVGGSHLTGKNQPQDEKGLNFLLWAKRKCDAHAHLRLLAHDNHPLNTNRFYIPYLRVPGKIIYQGEFPQATLEYADLGIPLKVTGRFCSPFVPSDEISSATPGFYIDFSVEAEDGEAWEVSITTILTNATGFESSHLPKRNQMKFDGTSTAILMDTPGANEEDPTTGSMAISAEGENISYCAGYNWTGTHDGTADIRYQLQDLYADGSLRNWEHGQQPPLYAQGQKVDAFTPEQQKDFEEVCRSSYDILRHATYQSTSKEEPEDQDDFQRSAPGFDPRMDILTRQTALAVRWDGALCCKGSLAKDKSFTAQFTLGWYFPNHMVFDSTCSGGEAKRFNMGHEYAARFKDAYEVCLHLCSQRSKLLTPTLEFHDALYASSLPETVIDHLSSQLAELPRISWWTEANGFGLWEGLGCCGVHTTDVAYNASVPISLFFPRLAKSQLSLTRKFQREDGRIPHNFPASFNHPNDGWNRTDMMAQFVLMTYRDYCWNGKTEFLKDFYPNCVKAMKCMTLTDKDQNGLADAFGSDTTYDTWGMFGTTAFLSGLYLSAISALEVMANVCGDTETEAWAHDIFERGKISYNDELWNGEYLRLWSTADGDADNACMADQLAGYWYSVMLGLPGYLSEERVQSILTSIMKYNFIEGHGLRNGAYPEAEPKPLQYHANYMPGGVWTGIEYCVVSLLKYYNQDKNAQRILDDIYDRHKSSGGIWRQDECGTYYSRPLSAWSVLLGSQHFQYKADSRSIALTPSEQTHTSPVVIGSGWGVFSKTPSEQTLDWKLGNIDLKTVNFHVPTGSRIKNITKNGSENLHFSHIPRDAHTVQIQFDVPLTLTAKGKLQVNLHENDS